MEPTNSFEQEVLRKLADLESLFRRRLVDDKAKGQLINEVMTDLEERRRLDSGENLAGVFTEVMDAADRLRSGTASDAALHESVIEEILTVFERRGFAEIDTAGTLDPLLHEVVEIRGDDSSGGMTTIVACRRRGFTHEGRVVRPARVVVQREPTSAPPTTT